MEEGERGGSGGVREGGEERKRGAEEREGEKEGREKENEGECEFDSKNAKNKQWPHSEYSLPLGNWSTRRYNYHICFKVRETVCNNNPTDCNIIHHLT